MFFDIDADLVYTRPHMTKVDGKAVIIEENIRVVPTKKWKRIFISSNLIAAMQDKLTALDELFDIQKFGQMFAASAFDSPMICTPSTRSVLAQARILTKPSVCPTALARLFA